MAGEGLKFTGEVVLSGRDFIKEAEARELVEQKKLLFDQAQQDREEARKQARTEADNERYRNFQYDSSDLKSEYVDYLNASSEELVNWVAENSEALNEGDAALNREYIKKQDSFKKDVKELKDRTSRFNSITEDAISNPNLYKRTESGEGFSWEQTENDFVSKLNSGTIDGSLSLNTIDVKKAVIPKTTFDLDWEEWTGGIGKSQDLKVKTDKGVKTSYSQGQINSITESLNDKFKPSMVMDNEEAYLDYSNEGSQRNFFSEVKGNRAPSESKLDSIDPNVEGYDEVLAEEYSKWLVNKNLTEKGLYLSKEVKDLTTEKPEEVEPKYPELTKDVLHKFNPKNWELVVPEHYSGIDINGNISENANVITNISPSDIASGVDESAIENLFGNSSSTKVIVTRLTMDTQGNPVAIVKSHGSYNKATAVVPLHRLDSSKFTGDLAKPLFEYAKFMKEGVPTEESKKTGTSR